MLETDQILHWVPSDIVQCPPIGFGRFQVKSGRQQNTPHQAIPHSPIPYCLLWQRLICCCCHCPMCWHGTSTYCASKAHSYKERHQPVEATQQKCRRSAVEWRLQQSPLNFLPLSLAQHSPFCSFPDGMSRGGNRGGDTATTTEDSKKNGGKV